MDPLFGSETRARLLEELARAPRPKSGYWLARVIGAEPIQVTRILKQLRGFVEHTEKGWRLTDESLRRFLLDRSRREMAVRREEKDELLIRFGRKPRYERRPQAVR
jgi:DNA-binding IclR family transcriptional regulator